MAQVSVFQGTHLPPGKAEPRKDHLCEAINNLYSNPKQHHTEKKFGAPLFFFSKCPLYKSIGMVKSVINLLDHISSGFTLQEILHL